MRGKQSFGFVYRTAGVMNMAAINNPFTNLPDLQEALYSPCCQSILCRCAKHLAGASILVFSKGLRLMQFWFG